MYQEINLSTWNRNEIFSFFNKFEEPFFGITAKVDVTSSEKFSRMHGIPFFITYLYAAVKAVNNTEALRYRILGDLVVLYEKIHVSSTIGREDGSFGFSFIEWHKSMEVFISIAQNEISRVRSVSTLFPPENRTDVFHFSALPWIDFTALSHARTFNSGDSIPKISVGKVTGPEDGRTMSCSVHVHHGLADGRDVGLFLSHFQHNLDNMTEFYNIVN
jgi:chloramphenicol O-acetyltransferase type A